MTHTRNTPASRKESLAPDPAGLDDRSVRAWTERMAVRPLGDGRYAVEGESGATYVVDLERGRCACPDHQIRRERCKHLRRVAIEVTRGRVPAPDEQAATCAVCGARAPADGELPLCPDCRLVPGDLVRDRETGDPVLVVATTGRRADEVEISETGRTVADHPTNRGYGRTDPVVEVIYPRSVRADESPRRYSFPISRLERLPVPESR